MLADSSNPFACDNESDPIQELASPDASLRGQPVGAEAQVEQASASGQAGTSVSGPISLDAIARKLLDGNFILTALEFHTELLESGRELHRLRDYFSNPSHFELLQIPSCGGYTPCSLNAGNFALGRSPSIQTFDSIDFDELRPTSDDGGERRVEDRVAVLEFELRKSKETIRALRSQLTHVTTSSDCPVPSGSDGRETLDTPEYRLPPSPSMPRSQSIEQRPNISIPVKPHEERAINFLVNEYLLQTSFKLTAVTFSEENQNQDFDDWDEVGVDVPRPADLISMYREFSRSQPGYVRTRDFEQVVDLDMELNPFFDEAESTSGLMNRLNQENSELINKNQLLSEEIADMKYEIDNLQCTIDAATTAATLHRTAAGSAPCQCASSKLAAEESGTAAVIEPESGPNRVHFGSDEWSVSRRVPAPFRNCILATTQPVSMGLNEQRLVHEFVRLGSSSDDFILTLARCLPYIVPNVLLNKRDELIPVILGVVLLHPDSKERDKLLNMFFNIIKKPEDEQRQVILGGCAAFAKKAGSIKVETELLPQCWEQISHKYAERRLLVAEACGCLCPNLHPTVLSSLVLSMLQQMCLEEKEGRVREAAVRSLATLSVFIEDKDKFQQILDLTLKMIIDSDENVSKCAVTYLLPSVAEWSLEIGEFYSGVVQLFIQKISQILQTSGASQSANESLLSLYWSCLVNLIPHLYMSVLSSGPYTAKLAEILSADENGFAPDLDITRYPRISNPVKDPASLTVNRSAFGALTMLYDEHTGQEWYQSWDNMDWLTKTMLPSLLDCCGKLDVGLPKVLRISIEFFRQLCGCFGRPWTVATLKPMVLKRLDVTVVGEGATQELMSHAVSHMTLPVYICGVLATFLTDQNKKLLYEFLKYGILTFADIYYPRHALLAGFSELSETYSDQGVILDLVRELLLRDSAGVRRFCASILHVMIRNASEEMLKVKILPSLVTLASDKDLSVKVETVKGLGLILEKSTNAEIEDKVRMQLAALFEEPPPDLALALVRMLTVTAPNLDTEFRQEFVLPRLAVLTAITAHTRDPAKKQAVEAALFDAYSALSCCYLAPSAIVDSFLPGLRSLQRQLDPQRAKILASIDKEFQMKAQDGTERESSSGSAMAGTTGAGEIGVDVVRARMMDKFKDLKDRVDQQSKDVVPGLFKRK